MAKRTQTSGFKARQNKLKTKSGAIHKQGQTGIKNGGSFKTSSKASTNPYRKDPSGGKPGSQFRTRATINRLNMYRAKPDKAKMRKMPTDPNAGKI